MRHTGVNRCRTVIALAGVALLAACSAPAASPLGGPVPTAGVVIGNLMGHGGPPPGINAPLCGVVTVTRADGGQVVGTARVGAGGSFMVSLAPGVHRFAADCGAGAGEPVVITAGTTINVALWCAMA